MRTKSTPTSRVTIIVTLLLLAPAIPVPGFAQSAIPGAPAVPTAPALPDSAIIAAPLQPAATAVPAVVNTASPSPTEVALMAPPEPVRELMIGRPSPRHIWISGYRGRHYGRWDLPPREHVEWVEPRWEHRGNGFVFVSGAWRDAGIALGGFERRDHDNVRQEFFGYAPPPPRREFANERSRPSSRHVWISGYWGVENRRQVWVGGHWDRPPSENARWVEPRWERTREGSYAFHEGFWR